ncbi:MAG: histidinol-phosphatase [Phycisphaerae bacterium]
MQPADLARYLEFAVDIAKHAGALTLEYFQHSPHEETKSDHTPVTEADRGAEQLLRSRIEERYPDHGILGEEFGEKTAQLPVRWILDPIDGTYSFISGVPLYATLIALEWEQAMVLGVIHLPALRETIYAAKGLGCWWNGRPARVSTTATLAEARMCHTGTRGFLQIGCEDSFRRLRDACRADRGWSDAYAYALVATGRAEVAIDPRMSLWDVAALYPIIQEAGGQISDWCGNDNPHAGNAVATNGLLHRQALAHL